LFKAKQRSYVLNDPRYWRMQAEEIAVVASSMKDNITRQAMRRIASDYEVLAKRAEERLLNVTRVRD
jgi:hypothetical protein